MAFDGITTDSGKKVDTMDLSAYLKGWLAAERDFHEEMVDALVEWQEGVAIEDNTEIRRLLFADGWNDFVSGNIMYDGLEKRIL